MIGIFKHVHRSGRVYNDMKPDNVMLNLDRDGEMTVTLIDLGLAEKYHNTTTIKKEQFNGNILFSSLSQMDLNRTTRRDDMIALFYMSLYLMNDYRYVGDEKLV